MHLERITMTLMSPWHEPSWLDLSEAGTVVAGSLAEAEKRHHWPQLASGHLEVVMNPGEHPSC